jgi:hypothetical protein
MIASLAALALSSALLRQFPKAMESMLSTLRSVSTAALALMFALWTLPRLSNYILDGVVS